MPDDSRYVPASGRAGLTRFYDLGVRLTMRESRWRPLLIDAVAASDPKVVVDVGCGTGTLTIPLASRLPNAQVIGVDGDDEVLGLAQAKAGSDRVDWRKGLADGLPVEDAQADAVVTSLVFHHLPLDTKRRALAEMRRVLRPGGRLFVADWAKPQDPVMSAAFYALQVLDGFATTRDNRQGLIPELIVDAGFSQPSVLRRLRTVMGSFEVLASS